MAPTVVSLRLPKTKKRRGPGSLVVGAELADASATTAPTRAGQLIIPLIDQPPGPSVASRTADELAAESLLRDLDSGTGAGRRQEAELSIASCDRAGSGRNDQPMLIRNMIPGLKDEENEKRRFALDIGARPAELSIDSTAYSSVPIEDFGAAMLRGMGWTKESGVGVGRNKKVVKPYLLENRPSLLGLGATPKPEAERRKKIIAPGEKRAEHRAWLCLGALVRIIGGRNEGEYAVVGKLDGVPGLDNVLLHLDPGVDAVKGKKLPEATVKRSLLELVDASKLSSNHAARSLLKAYKVQLQRERDAPPDEDLSSSGKPRRRARSRSAERQKRKRHKKRGSSRSPERPRKPRSCWLLPGIRVRIVSKGIAQGRFYGQKATVQDILDLDACTCVIYVGGATYEGVPQRRLETALPKAGGEIAVVMGKFRGARGKLLERSNSKHKAVVQLYGDQVIETMPYECVAEYTGESERDYLL